MAAGHRGCWHPGVSHGPVPAAADSYGMAAEAAVRQHVRKSLDQHREQLAVTDRSSGSCLSLLLGGAAAQYRAAGWGEEAGDTCSRLEKAPSIRWQQPCPPGCWASPQTLYLQLAGLREALPSLLGKGHMSRDYPPWLGQAGGEGGIACLPWDDQLRDCQGRSPRPSPAQSNHSTPTTARRNCRETPARMGTR